MRKLIEEWIDAIRSEFGRIVLPQLPSLLEEIPRELRRVDVDTDDLFDQVERGAAQRVHLSPRVRAIVNEAASRQGKRLKKSVAKVLGIRPELGEPWLAQLLESSVKESVRNIKRVSGTFLATAEKLISNAIAQGESLRSLTKDLTQDFIDEGMEAKRAKQRAKLVARDQIGSVISGLDRARQTQLGVTRYTWRTSVDERVRPSHREREGEVFEWNRSIEAQLREKGLDVDRIDGHPGRPINCRCTAEPVLTDLLDDLPAV
ncbi:MAG: minor capsid protein [Deltaproteobacteria bacterium]|nr:minor capsid protein [Deltaproteobacteria bacterium]